MSSSGRRMENIKVFGTLVAALIRKTNVQLKEKVGLKIILKG